MPTEPSVTNKKITSPASHERARPVSSKKPTSIHREVPAFAPRHHKKLAPTPAPHAAPAQATEREPH
jgi:hypothetical protein